MKGAVRIRDKGVVKIYVTGGVNQGEGQFFSRKNGEVKIILNMK